MFELCFEFVKKPFRCEAYLAAHRPLRDRPRGIRMSNQPSSITRRLSAAALLAAIVLSSSATGHATPPGGVTIAVIGDTPYGAATPGGPQAPDGTAFPNLATSINADADVSLVVHLGDTKNGSTSCSDAYLDLVKDWFNGTNGKGPGLADPLVYTPGDNEWTDCHRANNVAFVPTSNGALPAGRLETLRSKYYPIAGQTIGAGTPRAVDTQASVPGFSPFVENTKWVDANVQFGVVHVVGSNNGVLPWFTQAGQTPQTPAQLADQTAELAARKAAALAWIDAIFDAAVADNRAGVMLGMQADMWDVFPGSPVNQFDDIIVKIAQRSIAFGKPVLLMQGDSHIYKVDKPLDGSVASTALGALHPYNPSANPTAYPPVANLTRIVVPGSNGASPNGLDTWLKLTVDPSTPQVFSHQLLPVSTVPPVEIPEAPSVVLMSATMAAGLLLIVTMQRRRRLAPS